MSGFLGAIWTVLKFLGNWYIGIFGIFIGVMEFVKMTNPIIRFLLGNFLTLWVVAGLLKWLFIDSLFTIFGLRDGSYMKNWVLHIFSLPSCLIMPWKSLYSIIEEREYNKREAAMDSQFLAKYGYSRPRAAAYPDGNPYTSQEAPKNSDNRKAGAYISSNDVTFVDGDFVYAPNGDILMSMGDGSYGCSKKSCTSEKGRHKTKKLIYTG